MSPLELLPKQILAYWPVIALLPGLLAVAKASVHPDVKGWLGGRRIRKILAALDPELYTCHHGLYIPRQDGMGLTRIDLVVVSSCGIFVIGTKNFTGWIWGTVKQRNWTRQTYRRKSLFSNPLHRNKLHISSLSAHLWLPENRFHSLVVFAGDATFKTPMVENVLRQDPIPWILSRNTPLLTPAELETARARLAALGHTTGRKPASKTHIAALRARHC